MFPALTSSSHDFPIMGFLFLGAAHRAPQSTSGTEMEYPPSFCQEGPFWISHLGSWGCTFPSPEVRVEHVLLTWEVARREESPAVAASGSTGVRRTVLLARQRLPLSSGPRYPRSFSIEGRPARSSQPAEGGDFGLRSPVTSQ